MLNIDSGALGWAAFAIVAAIIEVLVPHFGIVFAAMGAVAAAIAAVFGIGLPFQIAVFLVATGVSVALLRERFVKSMAGRKMPSRAEAHAGREGVVTLDIEPLVGSGRVNVGGEDWAARADVSIAAGTRILVVGSDGIVLKVTPT
jgi:inner membrane protein